jgi:hypothetical protein
LVFAPLKIGIGDGLQGGNKTAQVMADPPYALLLLGGNFETDWPRLGVCRFVSFVNTYSDGVTLLLRFHNIEHEGIDENGALPASMCQVRDAGDFFYVSCFYHKARHALLKLAPGK